MGSGRRSLEPSSTTSDLGTSTSKPSTSTFYVPSEAGLIAYWSAREPWLMDADGTDQRLLSTGIVLDSGPEWSPDGTKLAFTGWDPERSNPGGLCPTSGSSRPTEVKRTT